VLAPPHAGAVARAPPVNNTDGLASVVEDFEWPKDVPWIDTLVVPVRARAARHPPSARPPTHPCTNVRSDRDCSCRHGCPGSLCDSNRPRAPHSGRAIPGLASACVHGPHPARTPFPPGLFGRGDLLTPWARARADCGRRRC
jgi:hypothetical protein